MIPKTTEEGLEMGRLMVAAGRALDDPKKERAARTILFKLSKPRDIVLVRVSKMEEK